MDLEHAAGIIRKTRLGLDRQPESGNFVGDELLRCGACTGPITGRNPQISAYGNLDAMYGCGDCDAGKVLVRVVDAQLQVIAIRYWSNPEPVASWRRERLAAIDSEIAEMLAVGDYARDPRNRKALRRALGRGSNRILDRVLGSGTDEPKRSLDALIKRLAELVHERASLSAALDGGPPPGAVARLAGLDLLRNEYAVISDPIFARVFPESAAVFGDRRQREARVPGAERELWALLHESAWADAAPEPPPTESDVLTMDWARSSTTRVGRRRALLRITAADWLLVLHPRTEHARAHVTAST
jgi:hypothetical protein